MKYHCQTKGGYEEPSLSMCRTMVIRDEKYSMFHASAPSCSLCVCA
jgi:hypothetical protein